jgi:hypothetical protein
VVPHTPRETRCRAPQAPGAFKGLAAHLWRQRRARDVAEHCGSQHESRCTVRCMSVAWRCDYRHKAYNRDQPWRMRHYQSLQGSEEGTCDRNRTAGAGLIRIRSSCTKI